jgi:hypothetical protein
MTIRKRHAASPCDRVASTQQKVHSNPKSETHAGQGAAVRGARIRDRPTSAPYRRDRFVHPGVSCVGATRKCLESPYNSYLHCFCHDRHTTRPTATTRRRAPPTAAALPPTLPPNTRPRSSRPRIIETRSTRRQSTRPRSTRQQSIHLSSKPRRGTRRPSTRQPSTRLPVARPPSTRPPSRPRRGLRRHRAASAPEGAAAAAGGDRRQRISSPPRLRVATRTSRLASGCSPSMDLCAHIAAAASRRV